MNDIVTRLRDWRDVNLARLHLLMEEAADEVARLRADNSRRANLEQGLRDGIVRLSANVDCPGRDNAANEDNTPAAHATPSERSEHNGCTLTDEEREAISRDLSWLQWCKDNSQIGDIGKRDIATLRSLLQRL